MSGKCNVKKNDQVTVISGKEKGKTGKVLRVLPKKESVLIEKVNFVKRHTRPSSQNRQGGIIEKESPVHLSKVMVVCAKCNAPVKTGTKLLEDGKRVRFCKKCSEVIDL
jgi:large subunit ribosomal protein L24